jgi:hypothetical protein
MRGLWLWLPLALVAARAMFRVVPAMARLLRWKIRTFRHRHLQLVPALPVAEWAPEDDIAEPETDEGYPQGVQDGYNLHFLQQQPVMLGGPYDA